MKYLIIILTLILLSSCSSKVNHNIRLPQDVPPVSVGPDFIGAAAFCDNRYGKLTPEAEACFKDFREYFKLQLSLDLESIEKYCKTKYPELSNTDECEQELIQMFNLFNK